MQVVYFNGLKFTRPNNKCYFRNNATQERLHRYVWKYYNGDIPEGYEIHHKDFDKGNNDISNLEMLTVAEHRALHARLLTDEQREWYRNNLLTNAAPKAVEWHKSEEGRKWHSKHSAENMANREEKEYTCTQCGKPFKTIHRYSKTSNHFCSNACKAKFRRQSGVDDIDAVCPICGKPFRTSKLRPSVTCSRSCANTYRSLPL